METEGASKYVLLYVLTQPLPTKPLLNMILQQSYARIAALGLDQFHNMLMGNINHHCEFSVFKRKKEETVTCSSAF